MAEQLHVSSKHHKHSNICQCMKPYPTVGLADDKIGLFIARFRLMIEENMHVVMTLYQEYLMVKFET
jgi:hypothetical protein